MKSCWLVLLTVSFSISVNAQDLQWAVAFSGSQNITGRAIAEDSQGNTYISGKFTGTVDFDPDSSVYNMTAISGADNIFVCKLNSNGNLIWAKQFSLNYGYLYQLAVDKYGSVLITGAFSDTCDFDPGTGVYNLIANGITDIYLVKLSSSGQLIWAHNYGGTSHDDSYGIHLDTLGNSYITGGRGPNVYISKISPSGYLNWSKEMIITNGLALGFSICTDDSGNVYSVGNFRGTIDMDPDSGTYNLTDIGNDYDVYISKLDSSGNFIWAKQIIGSDMSEVASILVDHYGHLYLAGRFSGNLSLGTLSLSSSKYETFVAKMNVSGMFLWAKKTNSQNTTNTESMVLDANVNMYITGDFKGVTDFDPGVGTANLTSTGLRDAFILKLDSSGNYLWSRSYGGPGFDDYSYSIAVDNSGYILSTGSFGGTADFDPDSTVFQLTSTGGKDAFVQKLSSCLKDSVNLNILACNSYTSPSGHHTWKSSGTYRDILINKVGCDSILNINLIISSIDTSVNLVGGTFISNADSTKYQWINCDSDSILVADTTQSFTPIVNGTYKVAIYNGNCWDTSACYAINNVSLEKNDFESNIKIYPNPASGKLFIKWEKSLDVAMIKILSIDGRIILKRSEVSDSIHDCALDVQNLPVGIYIISLEGKTFHENQKVVISR